MPYEWKLQTNIETNSNNERVEINKLSHSSNVPDHKL